MASRRAEYIAVGVLVLLWALFFWRVLTPIEADKAAFELGDFSGQFLAFGAYQYERFTEGEVPLWNPYNNSGLPFIADTQAAVFYPPRLITIAIARLAGGWSYNALQLEAIFHVLGYTLAMYALARRLTGSIYGGLVAAVIGGYGGYTAGYPPLQLALLEAGVWLPLVILSLHDAVDTDTVKLHLLLLAGFTLGVSWLAGHPQTSWFLTYLSVAYFGFRLWQMGAWQAGRFIWGVAVFGTVTFGTTAVTFLPGIEYLAQTARSGMGYAGKTNGFPLQDLLQFAYPGVVSLFSPLYIGVIGLILVVLALQTQRRTAIFWAGVAGVGLLWSFGGNTAFFDALYNLLPGLRFFRGQERAAYLVAHSLAIVAAFAFVLPLEPANTQRWAQRLLFPLGAAGLAFAVVAFLWLGFPDAYGDVIGPFTFTALIVAGLYGLVRLSTAHPAVLRVGVLALLVFELYSVNMNAPSNYDDQPAADQVAMSPPPLVAPVLPTEDTVTRVDGFRGLTANYGSLYGVYDARGISPLFLAGLDALQRPPFADPAAFEINPTFWELNAVEYVYSGWEALPIPADVIGQGEDQFGTVFLHQLEDPRPFAHLVYNVDIVDSDAFARALLADPAYSPRDAVILHSMPSVWPDTASSGSSATLTDFKPESFTVQVNTPTNAILTLAHPHYPGWQATLDGRPVELLRAYGGFSAVATPAGEHEIQLSYRPLSFRVGAGLSIITWVGLGVLGLYTLATRRRTNANHESLT